MSGTAKSLKNNFFTRKNIKNKISIDKLNKISNGKI